MLTVPLLITMEILSEDPQFDYSKPVDGSDPRTDWQGIRIR